MVELMGVVRQQGDYYWLLSKIREGDLDKEVDKAFLLRFVAKRTSGGEVNDKPYI